MKRLSDRISAAISGVKCPGCGERVVPTLVSSGDTAASTAGKRWSFIWLPPRGEVCPKCDFPLARYAGRRKWIWLFLAGPVLLAVAMLLFVSSLIGNLPGWFGWLPRVTAAAGLVAFLVGFVGLIVGGRHGPVRSDIPGEKVRSGNS
ncbi:MAG: hypothetical protein GTN62_01025 [Gemmatimonadales bacterium]|nr:hypothetical protein [Gemmatimonadales bacterium]NIN48686.1 hypothetical protein [Gemmatimonadales bacterium]NIP06150.1 hypothetical protein [Gemmatimonadales bacterium]NIR01324.1 hypothetical protein [Gemmatimonadales bacterium]